MDRSEVRRVKEIARRPPETKAHEGLCCPRCGRGLWPLSSGDTFRFQCGSGHEHRARDLGPGADDRLRQGFERLLGEWEARLACLWTSARAAQANGCPAIAEIFLRRVRGVAERARALRSRLGAPPGGVSTAPVTRTPAGS